ncbi:putative small nucleolar ribonucleoprotein complex subunit [Talaromyces proteolyticus]|uniref:U three protein 7 n=1 Tax=Talaromyces proteolyticus TaxID=1131652 RepID=A0AAD4L2X8_9EURO|nr:putative small nucleolar ribonucleoprotein complex subunit [Talaromyces proteolyticus]KAH8705636.1 putative small nucleolar ribonucleoprotein complex subunit [Talaromyces proteolyticus]
MAAVTKALAQSGQKRSPQDIIAAREGKKRLVEATQKYGRGKAVRLKGIKDKKLRGNLRAVEDRYQTAALRAKDAEILLENDGGFLEPEGELEKTYKVRQDDIKENIGIEVAKKGFELKLEDFGPYRADYTRNGKNLLLAGRKGHIATMDWRAGKLGCELQLGETIRDAKWLHNNQYFAVAQQKYVYIYDHSGAELHCLNKHVEARYLEFLPYHFLLASAATSGFLKYTDTSTGQLVAELPTRLGSPTSLCQNPWNAILHVGHQNGTVSLWSPNSQTALVKALVHRGPVRSMAIDRQGRYMVSTGQDMRMNVWDIRMFKSIHSYSCYQPGASVSISERGLTAVGWGTKVSVWRGLFDAAAANEEKVQSPYMSWGGDGQRIETVRWCPFEDVLGVTHDKGFASVIVPGAGEPNFDSMEVNPYETIKQRQEAEVKALLNKLQPEMISLDPDYIGKIDNVTETKRREERQEEQKPEDAIEKLKNRGRGRNSALRKYLRKKGKTNVIDEKRLKAEALQSERKSRQNEALQNQRQELGPALSRFASKKDS